LWRLSSPDAAYENGAGAVAPADLLKLKELIEQGNLKPYLARIFGLAEIAQAHALLERGGLVSKVAIKLP
jgi:NADPH:quinone reductase-like Zn-dependent oxidoreductase